MTLRSAMLVVPVGNISTTPRLVKTVCLDIERLSVQVTVSFTSLAQAAVEVNMVGSLTQLTSHRDASPDNTFQLRRNRITASHHQSASSVIGLLRIRINLRDKNSSQYSGTFCKQTPSRKAIWITESSLLLYLFICLTLICI